MTKSQIIEQLFTGKNFNDCIRKMEPEHLRDDLRMEVIAIVCEMSEELILGLHARRELNFYVARIVFNQIKSDTSPFYRKYREKSLTYVEEYDDRSHAEEFNATLQRHFAAVANRVYAAISKDDDEIEERQEREELEDQALREIDNLYWYNSELVRLYSQGKSYREIESMTGIPHVSCYHSIQKSIKQIKEKLKA